MTERAAAAIADRFQKTSECAEWEGRTGIALACPEVWNDAAPVLFACWNGYGLHFLCGRDHSRELFEWSSEVHVMLHVELVELLVRDPSLAALATMRSRHRARRSTISAPWVPEDDLTSWWF
jgi:hypothetical protein